MTGPERQRLTDLRRALLDLHKTLLDWERTAYERVHGRVSGHQLLHATLRDPQFAWLRPVSELIVRLDELLEQPPGDATGSIEPLLDQARQLLVTDAAGGPYAQRYLTALQEHPDAVFAHRVVVGVLHDTPDRTH